MEEWEFPMGMSWGMMGEGPDEGEVVELPVRMSWEIEILRPRHGMSPEFCDDLLIPGCVPEIPRT